jgi:hypothetical protein
LEIKAEHCRLTTVSHLDISPKQMATMEEDCHLIEAALASDERITSLDDEVRALFRTHHSSIPGVGTICWVNPDEPDETALPWLKAGAPADRHRMLGLPSKPSKKR